jgi:hypothetical protein
VLALGPGDAIGDLLVSGLDRPRGGGPHLRPEAGVAGLALLIAAEPRLTATAIQTVGVKGYDGFALALVTEVTE